MKFNTLGDAIALAEFAHRNQLDKAGIHYIEHPKRVMDAVRAMGAKPYIQAAAVLHDVLEDTPFTHQHLLELGVSVATVHLVALVSRNYYVNGAGEIWQGKDTHYTSGKIPQDVYYARIRENPDARLIKLADITDNMLPCRTSYFDQETQKRLKEKYTKALLAISA